MGNTSSVLSSLERHTIQKINKNPQGRERVRDRPALHDGILEKDGTKKVFVQNGMLVIAGIHLGVLFI